jgi:hypothetical protein
MKKSVLPLLAAVIAVLAAPAWCAPLEKSHVPADAKWIAHVDFEAFWAGGIGQWAAAEFGPQVQPKLDAMRRLLGSDLSRDIRGLTLFGPDSVEQNAVALIYGKFDRQRLLDLLAGNEAYAESQHGKQMIYQWRDDFRKKEQSGAFAADNLIVISQSKSGVASVLDVMGKQAAPLAEDRAARLWSLTEGTQGAFMIAAADDVASLAKGQEHATILQNSKMLTFIADEKDGQTRLFLLLEANDIEAAQQVEMFARGMLAFAMLKQKDHPELAPVIMAATLTRNDERLSFDFSYPTANLLTLFEKFKPLVSMNIR